MWIALALLAVAALAASLGAMARAARVSALEDTLARAVNRLAALESGLACGPEAKQFDGIRSVEARLDEAIEGAGSVAEEIHRLGGRVTKLEETTDAYATKSRADALLDAVAHLGERVAQLDRGLQSLADRHAEFTAAVAESVDALKGRIVAVEAGKVPGNDPE